MTNEECSALLVRTNDGVFDAYASIRASYRAGMLKAAEIFEKLLTDDVAPTFCVQAVREAAKDKGET